MLLRRVVGGFFLCTHKALCGSAQHRAVGAPKRLARPPFILPTQSLFWPHLYSTNEEPTETPANAKGGTKVCLSHEETSKLLKLLKVEEFKKHLLKNGNDCMPLAEVIGVCMKLGISSKAEAEEVVKRLDEAGVILFFRKKVFLRPDKLAEVLATVIPLSLVQEDDPRREELALMQKEKEEIDRIARRKVRKMLWTALVVFILQTLVFFRLTFWELSWDVMEPIAFYVSSCGVIAGFLYFILTSRNPSFQDLMHTFFSSKQRKLMKKRHFNIERFKELQMQCGLQPSEKGQNVGHDF